MAFKELSPNQIGGNVFSQIGDDWMLITAGKEGAFNTMTASWGAFGVLWNRPVTFVFIRPSRYTYEFVEREAYYSLSFFGEEFRPALQLCGTRSGREMHAEKQRHAAQIRAVNSMGRILRDFCMVVPPGVGIRGSGVWVRCVIRYSLFVTSTQAAFRPPRLNR